MDDERKMPDERIMQRLQKLWIMADKGTPEERSIAAVKAQKILLEYRIDMAKELQATPEEIVQIVCDDSVNLYTKWIYRLAGVIAKNYRCRYLCEIVQGTKGKLVRCYIVGLKLDAEIAKDTLERTVKYAARESKQVLNYYQYRHGTTKGVKEEFMNGYIEGLEEAFYQQILSQNEFAVAVVVPNEVNEYIKSYETITLHHLRTKSANTGYARHAGYQKGREFLQESRDKLEYSL